MLVDWFEHKNIAIVGNANSLFDASYGEEIDSHDIVVRINRSSSICFKENEEKNVLCQGNKTDVWAFSFADSMEKELNEHHKDIPHLIQMNDIKKNKAKLEFNFEYMESSLIEKLAKSLDNMKKRIDRDYIRKEMIKVNYDEKFRHIKKHRGYLLQDLMRQDMMKNIENQISLNKKIIPSTGLRLLEYISLCNPKSVNVYGFDWKETPTFYDAKKETRITEKRHNHNFFLERNYCKEFYRDRASFIFHMPDGSTL
jgi:hypothetical protein